MPQPTEPNSPEELAQIIRGLTETNQKLWKRVADLEQRCTDYEKRLQRLEEKANYEETLQIEWSER